MCEHLFQVTFILVLIRKLLLNQLSQRSLTEARVLSHTSGVLWKRASSCCLCYKIWSFISLSVFSHRGKVDTSHSQLEPNTEREGSSWCGDGTSCRFCLLGSVFGSVQLSSPPWGCITLLQDGMLLSASLSLSLSLSLSRSLCLSLSLPHV